MRNRSVWTALGRVVSVGSMLGLLGIGTSGCIQLDHPHKHPGAKAHAPKGKAHGYWRKHAEEDHPARQHGHKPKAELVFDSGLGLYVVIGYPGHYHDGHHYYREVDGSWMVSAELDAHWAPIHVQDLPAGLRKHRGHGKHIRGHSGKGHPASTPRR